MNKLFDGLLQYEIILSFLGIILFLVLLFLTVYMVITNRKVNKILAFYMVPIIMIGFPGIKKIQFKGAILDLKTQVELSSSSGSTPDQKAEIAGMISDINTDRISSPESYLIVAKAYAITGDTLNAYKSAEEALNINPNLHDAKNLKENLLNNPMVRIDKKISELNQNPSNNRLKEELNNYLMNIRPESIENPADFLTIARANEAIGETSEARKYADSALIVNPEYKEAARFKRRLITNK
jgi:tetratricopeptide (TPR) repeat protein